MLTNRSRAALRRSPAQHPILASCTALVVVAGGLSGAAAHSADLAAAYRAPDAVVLDATRDPVLIQLGGVQEHASFVLERFEIAVRGVASNQGLDYDDALFVQLYGFLPTFLQQRATELALMAQAESRGIVVTDEQIDAVVERVRASLARDEAAYGAALARAGFRSEDHLRAMVRESELVRLAAEAIRASVEVRPEQVQVAYQAQRDRFVTPAQVCARHVLVADRERATEVVARIAAGEPFTDVARTESLDAGSAIRGGELGCIRQGATVAAFDAALFAATGPGLLGPVETQFGLHVIEVYEVRPSRVQPFAEVRAELEAELRSALGEAALAAIIDASGARTFPDAIPALEGHVAPAEAIDPAAGI